MDAETKTPSFEEAIHQLEEITRQLERGSLTLEESIAAYERGLELSTICKKSLEKAERKLEHLSENKEGKVEHNNVEGGLAKQNELFEP